MAKKRASETMVEMVQRSEQDQACKAKKRASETRVETVQRQEQNRARMAKKEHLKVWYKHRNRIKHVKPKRECLKLG